MKNHKIKLILVLSAVLLLFFTSLNVFTSYVKMKKTVEESIANQSLAAAESIASALNKETYQKFLNDPVKNEYYWELTNYLVDAREKLGALFVYTLKIDNPKVSTIMIGGLPKELDDSYSIGAVCTVPEKQVKRAFEGNTYVTNIIEDADFGSYLSVGVPIKDEAGKVMGYLGIDISVDTLNDIKGTVLKNNILLFIFNGAFILVVIGSFFLLQRWYQKEVAKAVGYTEDTYQAELKTLITSISSLRHDFTNHIQVLHGLLQLGESKQAQQYVSSLSKEVLAIESLKLNIDHPGLSILLQTKKLTAQNYHIDMNFTVSHDEFDKIKTTDLIIILSNLIDNAIDATIALPEAEREIAISCKKDVTQYVFKITNTGPEIIENEHIFEQGYSTKKAEQGKIRGQGLFIVKEVVNRYNGKLSIDSLNELETIAIVEIPLKKN
ncbi:GHKL domain-containing protein [Sporosarcina sp. ANT_H38]|uniref:sensor histidine kinase n=1 Tax=Sporosarcina sp. ANT_H38 TaxID=2597358 RepID=UPI0011F2F82A|nr:GHKL domain-containing protein [Sporosarcina sp. ANT_H38]KAA0955903.1 GHKL domain-containing protein [Sporosarcina sp. ANT_H38]